MYARDHGSVVTKDRALVEQMPIAVAAGSAERKIHRPLVARIDALHRIVPVVPVRSVPRDAEPEGGVFVALPMAPCQSISSTIPELNELPLAGLKQKG